MSQKRIIVPDEILKRISIKNVKDEIGHDLMGMYCDLYLDNKKIGYYNDDGWGGEPEIEISSEVQSKIMELLNKHNWRNKMYTEGGWDFYDNEEKITEHCQLNSLIEYLHSEKLKEKSMKKIAKQSEKEILYGRWDHYTRSSFKGGMTLEQMVRSYGLHKVQEYIDNQIRSKLKEGQEILNTNFDVLGLKK